MRAGNFQGERSRLAFPSGRRKAQFFLLGAVLLAILFFVGTPLITRTFSSPSLDLPYLSENLRLELPAAFNLGLNESNELGVMKNFSLFLNATFADHLINFSILWIYSRNLSSNLNVTIGNFLGGNASVNLTIGSSEQLILVESNSTNSTTFTSPGSLFNLTIEFGPANTTVEWFRDKANLYAFFSLGRGKDRAQDEVTG